MSHRLAGDDIHATVEHLAELVTIAKQFWHELMIILEAGDARSVVDRENAINQRIIETEDQVLLAKKDLDDPILFALNLLTATHACRSTDFAGVGIVLYTPPLDFLAVPLGGWASPRPALPVVGSFAVSEALASLSAQRSAWHDGFHFVDYSTQSLTHVSQFLAPSLDDVIRNVPGELPSGARQLSALLASKSRCVLCVGLLTADQHISIYQEGRLMQRAPVDLA